MCDWFLEQIRNINTPTVLASIFSSWGLREFVDWRKRRNLQAQQASIEEMLLQRKSMFDLELEKMKSQCQQEIQVDYLQTQLKAASLFKVYPELHWAFKETEGLVFQLLFHSVEWYVEAYKSWCSLTKKLAEHALFLDDDLCGRCVDAKDVLISTIRTHAKLDKKAKESVVADINNKVGGITSLMKLHLLDNPVN